MNHQTTVTVYFVDISGQSPLIVNSTHNKFNSMMMGALIQRKGNGPDVSVTVTGCWCANSNYWDASLRRSEGSNSIKAAHMLM